MAVEIVTIENEKYHHVLKTPADNIAFPLSVEDQELIVAMKNKLQDLGGVGLAAPQVNYAKKIIAIYIPEKACLLREHAEPYSMHILINPSYEPSNDAIINFDYEGCYSVSSKAGKVPRYDAIQLRYFDENGLFHNQTEYGFYARVLQHEIDHINGVLITA